jgi:hypothetical protein
MKWTTNGNCHRSGDYTIMEHEQRDRRWFTLEFGSEYVAPGSFPTLDAAKGAARLHDQKEAANA